MSLALILYLFLLTFLNFCDLTTLLFSSFLICILLYPSSKKHTLLNRNLVYMVLMYWSKIKIFLTYIYTLTPSTLTITKLKWKPLFKKSSYFGIYRSCRNQHLNK